MHKVLAALIMALLAVPAMADENAEAVVICGPTDSDFDGNGISDILWRNGDTGKVQVYFMEDGEIESIEDVALLPGWTVEQVAHFNDDCYADILWRNEENLRLVVWLMYGAQVIERVDLDKRPGQQWQVVSQ